MKIYRTKQFKKQYNKLPNKIQKQFNTRLQLFVIDQLHQSLRVHALKGDFVGMWSMNVNGDVRAVYKIVDGDIYIYDMIGTHSQLYG
jgi:addiction module RelE/StbE family toxin